MAEPIQAETTMVKLPKLFLYFQPISNSFLLSFFISPLLNFFFLRPRIPLFGWLFMFDFVGIVFGLSFTKVGF